MNWRPIVLAMLAVMTLACGTGIRAAQAQDCSNESALRSSAQGASVELSFRNASNEARRLYWIDPNGNRKFIALIRPGSIYSQPTAASHAWVVTDDHEKCLHAVTATAEPQSIDVSGQTVAQISAPGAGTQSPIDATPPESATSPDTTSSTSEPAKVAAPLLTDPPAADAGQPAASDDTLSAAANAASDAAQEDVSVEVPKVSPIEQLGLTGNLRVLAVADEGKSLNNQASGAVEVVRVNPEWDSGQWSFEPVNDTPFVRIKNNWKRTYLTDVNGTLRAVAAQADADPSHWSVEPVDGTAYIQLRNRETDRFLLNLNGVPNLVSDYRQDQERQSYWQVNPASETVAVTAPRIAALSAYNSAVTDCRDIGGVWTGSSCRSSYAAMGYTATQPLACPRGWFWDQQSGECLYEVQGSAAACPPWQQGPGGQCISNLTCRGGHLRMSRRGASCDCPFGMAPWGNYPNLSCKPSVARIIPLLLMSKLGGKLDNKHGDRRIALGQAYGNKQFGKNQQTNVNNSTGLIIKVTKQTTVPVIPGNNNVGNNKPVITGPVFSNPIVVNPNGPKPSGINTTNINPTGNNTSGANKPGGNTPIGVLTNPSNPQNANTNTTTNPNTRPPVVNTTTNSGQSPALEKAVSDFNKMSPQQKVQVLNACQNSTSPNCAAIRQSAGQNAKVNTGINPNVPINPNNRPGNTTATTTNNAGTPNNPLNNQGRPGQTTTTNTTATNNPAQNPNQTDAIQRACQANPNLPICRGQQPQNTGRITPPGTNPNQPVNNQQAQNDAKAKAEAEAKAKADAAAKQKAEADAKARTDAAARQKAEAEAKAKADSAAKQKAEADAKARAAAAARQKAEAEAKAKADAAAKQKAEADAKARAAAAARQKAEAEAKARTEAANRAKTAAEAAARAKAAAEAKARAEAAARARINAANQARINAQNQARAKAASQARQSQNRPSNGGCPPGRRRLPNGACA